ncbi:unnamed protein product [Allacma fusca]|uniref:Uncharacterized protein n=1 Tax=Allacma fusca TaxID=39272 RepID=A0A8J2JW41_9HEXA|nr:unnamed protein product [Allacma fusca]
MAGSESNAFCTHRGYSSIIRCPYEDSAKEITMLNGFVKIEIVLSSICTPSRLVFTDNDFTEELSCDVQTPDRSYNEDDNDNDGNDIPNHKEDINADFNISNYAYEDTPEDMNLNRSEFSIDVQFWDAPALPDRLQDNEPVGPSKAVGLTTSVSMLQVTL